MSAVFQIFRSVAFMALFCSFAEVSAQYFPIRDFWKSHRWEATFGMGTSNYLGDLGGRDSEENTLKFLNIEPSEFKANFHFGVKYNVAYRHAVAGNFALLRVAGDDALTGNTLRNNRNLSFRSTVAEMAFRYEFHILRPKIGHFGRVKWADNQKLRLLGMYAYAGLGAFYFNPKAQYNGDWVALQPLGTEGQGLPNGPGDFYSRVAMCFPLGVSLNYYLGFKTTIGADFGYRFTTTDYLDDVSGFYYDNDALRAARGDVAADLANRSPETGDGIWTTTGAIRGNPNNNDNYMTFTITLTTSIVHNKELRQKLMQNHERKKRQKGNAVKF